MIPRKVLKELVHWFGKEKILVLKGPRQVGKTTLMHMMEAHVDSNLPDAKSVFLAADNITNAALFETPQNLLFFLEKKHDFPKRFIYLFIDEFQYIKNAGLFLKNIFDQYKSNLQIIVCGSSSLEISKNTEFLTGRKIEFDIKPVDFTNFFTFTTGIDSSTIPVNKFGELELFYKTFGLQLKHALHDYLKYGGYPEVITTQNADDKKAILEDIVNTYIQQDVVNFLKVENVSGFNKLVKVLSAQIGNLLNVNEISGTIGLNYLTAQKYIDILIGTYVVTLVTPYFKNVRTEISKMPKVYMNDHGIRNFLLQRLEGDDIEGGLAENFVFNILGRRFDARNVHFYRTQTGTEIDFVVEKNFEDVLVCEVKYTSKVAYPVAMKHFAKKYEKVNKVQMVVTRDTLKKENGVFYVPACVLPFIRF